MTEKRDRKNLLKYETDKYDLMFTKYGFARDPDRRKHIDYMLSKIPRNRFAKVEELASLVAWLVSEENSFSTGAVFDLSGGRATY